MLLIIIFNQDYFKVDSTKPIQFRREIWVIKREPLRLILRKYLFQTGTNSTFAVGTGKPNRY